MHEWFNMPGARVSILDLDGTIAIIAEWIKAKRSRYICVADVHSLMRASIDHEHLNALAGADLVTPDGAPIVLFARLAGIENIRRVSGPDLFLRVCAHSAKLGWRHYFFGGRPGVAERLAAEITRRYPGLVIAGVDTPPFRPTSESEDNSYVTRMNVAKPDIVWVGLGCPKQEKWMAANRHRVDGAVIVGIGAAFDFYSGTATRAPFLIRQLGLEWAHRLVMEPRRLWKRYLILAPRFLLLATAFLLSGRIQKVNN